MNNIQTITTGMNRGMATAKGKIIEYKPQLLMFGAGGLSVAALATAIFNSEKAAELKAAKRIELERSDEKLHPIVERAKIEIAGLPAYIPSIAMETGSLICLGLSGKTWDERNAALAALYAAGQKGLEAYKDKVIEKIGENKESDIQDAVIEDEMERMKPEHESSIIVTGHGDTLMFDMPSGRWFYSDIEKVRKVENLVNNIVNNEMFAPLNTFYELLGLDEISLGDDIGWNANHALLDIRFVARTMAIEGEYEKPGLALAYDLTPLFR